MEQAFEIIDPKTAVFDIKKIDDRMKAIGALEDIDHEVIKPKPCMEQLNFTRFEIAVRKHSPNAVIGIREVVISGETKETSVLIAAAGNSLGKKLGDQLAQQIKTLLEQHYLNPF